MTTGSSAGAYRRAGRRPDPVANDDGGELVTRLLPRSQSQIEFLDQLVVVELVDGASFERDLAVHDHVAAVGDAQRLREILLGHQDRELVAVLELLDLVD